MIKSFHYCICFEGSMEASIYKRPFLIFFFLFCLYSDAWYLCQPNPGHLENWKHLHLLKPGCSRAVRSWYTSEIFTKLPAYVVMKMVHKSVLGMFKGLLMGSGQQERICRRILGIIFLLHSFEIRATLVDWLKK